MCPGRYSPFTSIRGVGTQDSRISPSQARSGVPSACKHGEASSVQEDGLVDLARRVQIAYGVRGKVPDHEGLTSDIACAPFVGDIGAPMPGIIYSHDRSVLHRAACLHHSIPSVQPRTRRLLLAAQSGGYLKSVWKNPWS